MTDKVTVVRYSYSGDKFELLVKPDPAFDYKIGKVTDVSKILVSDEIYTDSNKGTRATNEKLDQVFKTIDLTKIAEIIMKKGELNLTTEQRRKMIAEKRKKLKPLVTPRIGSKDKRENPLVLNFLKCPNLKSCQVKKILRCLTKKSSQNK